jgi:hypothetical protein
LLSWLRDYTERYPGGSAVIRRPAFKVTENNDVAVSWHLDLDDFTAGDSLTHILAYAAAVLVSDKSQFRSDLRCCKLESCGNFFLVERGKAGRPRDSYCSPEHLKVAHEKDSARRHRKAKHARIELEKTYKQQRRRHK